MKKVQMNGEHDDQFQKNRQISTSIHNAGCKIDFHCGPYCWMNWKPAGMWVPGRWTGSGSLIDGDEFDETKGMEAEE